MTLGYVCVRFLVPAAVMSKILPLSTDKKSALRDAGISVRIAEQIVPSTSEGKLLRSKRVSDEYPIQLVTLILCSCGLSYAGRLCRKLQGDFLTLKVLYQKALFNELSNSVILRFLEL